MDKAAGDSGNEQRVGNLELDRMVDLLLARLQHRVELGRLGHRSWKSVQDEAGASASPRWRPQCRLTPTCSQVALEHLLDHTDHDLVRDEAHPDP